MKGLTPMPSNNPIEKFDGISLDGFIQWVKEEYDKDPQAKVSVKFILEVLRPSLMKEANHD